MFWKKEVWRKIIKAENFLLNLFKQEIENCILLILRSPIFAKIISEPVLIMHVCNSSNLEPKAVRIFGSLLGCLPTEILAKSVEEKGDRSIHISLKITKQFSSKFSVAFVVLWFNFAMLNSVSLRVEPWTWWERTVPLPIINPR